MLALKRNRLSGSQARLTSARRSNVDAVARPRLLLALLEQAREVQVGAAADRGDDLAAPGEVGRVVVGGLPVRLGADQPRGGPLAEGAVVARDARDRAAVGPDVDRRVMRRPAAEGVDQVVDQGVRAGPRRTTTSSSSASCGPGTRRRRTAGTRRTGVGPPMSIAAPPPSAAIGRSSSAPVVDGGRSQREDEQPVAAADRRRERPRRRGPATARRPARPRRAGSGPARGGRASTAAAVVERPDRRRSSRPSGRPDRARTRTR